MGPEDSPNSCFCKTGLLVVGVLILKALIFGVSWPLILPSTQIVFELGVGHVHEAEVHCNLARQGRGVLRSAAPASQLHLEDYEISVPEGGQEGDAIEIDLAGERY